MGFNEGRAEIVDAVFADLAAGTATFVPLSGDTVSCSVRLSQDQEMFPDYQAQRVGLRLIMRYQTEDIDRDVYRGEYFLLDDVKYYVAEMVESNGKDLTRRVRMSVK